MALHGGRPTARMVDALDKYFSIDPVPDIVNKLDLRDGELTPARINGELLRDLKLEDIKFRGRTLFEGIPKP